MDEGHCGLPTDDLVPLAERLLEVPHVALALTSKVLVITGGPGVGKTTLVNAILRILSAKGRKAVAVCSDGTCGQTHERGHRVRGQDHPPPQLFTRALLANMDSDH